MNKLIMILVMTVFPLVSQANQWVFGEVESLDDYGSYGNGIYQVLIGLKNMQWGAGGDGVTNCTKRFRVKLGEQGITENEKGRIFSLMLSAYMAGKTVGLYVDPASGPYCLVQIGRLGNAFQ